MGQYQQWLLAQEIDRRLKAEIETLETELFYLQDRMTILEQVVPNSENMILQVLAAHLQQQDRQEQPAREAKRGPADSSGQALPAGRRTVPGAGTPPDPAARNEESTPSLPRTYPRDAMTADMLAFFEEHSQTDPDLSAFLRRERQGPPAGNGEDEETRRLNESIQRWFVRWHRQITSSVQEEETDDEQ